MKDPRPRAVRVADARLANRSGARHGESAERQRQRLESAERGDYSVWMIAYVTLLGILYLLTTGQFLAPPRTVVIRFIGWYQHNVSGGRNVCPRGEERHCSKQGLEAVQRLGAFRGIIAIFHIIGACKRYQRAHA